MDTSYTLGTYMYKQSTFFESMTIELWNAIALHEYDYEYASRAIAYSLEISNFETIFQLCKRLNSISCFKTAQLVVEMCIYIAMIMMIQMY